MAEVCKINDVEFEYEYTFKNSDGDENKYASSAVKGLTLIDSIFNPFLRGTIAVANPYDLFEEKYLLRGDGRDEVKIFLKPKDEEEKIEEEFILLQEDNSGDVEVRSENIKKFKIIHKDMLPFMDTIPYNKSFSGKIGDILKDIFIELLGEDKIDKENWESGDFDFSYIPPMSFRYIDLVYHLLKYFYGKDGELYTKALIMKNKKIGKYQMMYLTKIFSENKKNTTDAFTTADLSDKSVAENENNPPPDAKVSKFSSGLKNFAYNTPLYEWNNDFFINSVVHGYDKFLGVQKMKILKLEDIEKKWKTKFVDVFKAIGGSPKPFVVRNKTTKQKFRHYRTPYEVEDTVKMVEAEMCNLLTFYNLNCIFSNVGFTGREAGKFLDIVKIGEVKQKGDAKMYGRWFVTEVRHIFSSDTYTNEFKCCKTYVGSSSKIKNDVE
jgi:hypothetical protein